MFRISLKPSFEFLFSVSLLVSAVASFVFLATAVAAFFYGAIFHDWGRSLLAAVILLVFAYGFFWIKRLSARQAGTEVRIKGGSMMKEMQR